MDAARLLAQLGLSPQPDLSFPGAATDAWLPTGGPEIVSEDPASGAPIGTVRAAAAREYDQVLSRAAERFAEWRMRPAPVRGELVRRLGELLRRHKEPLGELISLEVGKIRAEGLGEVQEMIDICDFAVGLGRQLYGLTMASERGQHRMYEQWHPLGPVGIVTAFNFPMAVWAWNATIAAVCGDPCIWKPSPLAPLTSLAVQGLCQQVMREADAGGLFNLLIGGAELGQRMAQDPRLPLVSFTGSVAVGQRVAVEVASRLGRVLLELGGNNAVIVLDDADLDLAVRGITFAAVGTAGQRCTTTRRLFLQRGIADRVIARLIGAYQTIRIGDPLASGTLMGPLVTRAAVGRYRAALDLAVAQGGGCCTAGGCSSARATSSSRRSWRRRTAGGYRSPTRRPLGRSCTCSAWTGWSRPSRRRTASGRGCRARSSPTACGRRSGSCPLRARTAASPT